jgi:hypothetical protein
MITPAGKRLIVIILVTGALSVCTVYLFLWGNTPRNFTPSFIPSSSYVRDLDSGDVINSLLVLEERKDPIAIPKAIELLKRPDDYVWLSAALYLGACNRQEAVPYLIKSLRHADWRSDERAARYLKTITGTDFGTDFPKWQKWWLAKNPVTTFDWKSGLGFAPRLDREKQSAVVYALQEIRRAGGGIYEADGALIGVRFPRHLTDADLVRLREHFEVWKDSLKDLALGGVGITDEGLRSLKGLSHLQRLRLEDTSVSDAGIRELRQKLPQLEVLRVLRGRRGGSM